MFYTFLISFEWQKKAASLMYWGQFGVVCLPVSMRNL